jgi:signal transduction histidine kinase
VDRIRGLVATMARLGRGASEPAPRTPCEPEALAREVATLLAREAGARGVRLEVEADPGTPKVLAAREELQQVILNLVLNALHATPRGGSVLVRVRPEGRDWVSCEVCDTGRGIPAADLERIFDPFYTTKDPDQGTGLGLMICHGIVTEHGGSIEVESREGQGSRFRVRLPRAEACR